MQAVSDALCRKYGLSVIEHPQQGRGKQYGEWRAEQEQRPTWRGLIHTDIDEAIRQSMTEGLCGEGRQGYFGQTAGQGAIRATDAQFR